MLKKIVYVAVATAVLISACACGDARVESREYDTCAVFHEDVKSLGGLMFAEDCRYEVGGEFGALVNGAWYVITLDNNGTANKSDDIVVGVTEL